MINHLILKNLKKTRMFSDLLTDKSLSQLKKYMITGGLAFISEYIAFHLLLPEASKFMANSVGMLIGFWISFLLNRYWSFASKDKIYIQLLRYSVVFLINLIISNLLMYVFSDRIGMHPSVSKLIIMCLIVGWNFLIFKKIIYKR